RVGLGDGLAPSVDPLLRRFSASGGATQSRATKERAAPEGSSTLSGITASSHPTPPIGPAPSATAHRASSSPMFRLRGDFVLAVIAAIAIIGATASSLLLASTILRVRDQALGREIVPPENQIAEYTTVKVAKLAARERYDAIESFLRERGINLDDPGALRDE